MKSMFIVLLLLISNLLSCTKENNPVYSENNDADILSDADNAESADADLIDEDFSDEDFNFPNPDISELCLPDDDFQEDKIKIKMIGAYGATCAVTELNTVYCFGGLYDSASPQKIDIRNAGEIKILTVGYSHSCVLDDAGRIYCWGSGEYGQLGNGSNEKNMVPVDVDMNGIMKDKKIVGLTSGEYHSCALDDSGGIYCWGKNDEGQLGNGTIEDSSVPVAVDLSMLPENTSFTFISAHKSNTCALDSDGKGYCWGHASCDENGNRSDEYALVPEKVNNNLSDVKFVSITSRGAIDTEGVLHRWAYGYYRAYGNSDMIDELAYMKKKWVSLAPGYWHSCILDNEGEIYCWGDDSYGELGNGEDKEEECDGNLCNAPIAVYSEGVLKEKHIVFITTGNYHTCALDSEGGAYCWGKGISGEIGDFSVNDAIAPHSLFLNRRSELYGKKVISLSAGSEHTCAVDDKGTAYCWGSQEYGELGDGVEGFDVLNGISYEMLPKRVNTYGVLNCKKIVEIKSAGGTSGAYGYTCALDDEGKAYCWGYGENGELGNGLKETSLVPVAVDTSDILKGKKLVKLAVALGHACALDDRGEAYCWGKGQLGTGSYRISAVPLSVKSGELRFVKITAGQGYTCAIDVNGKVYCWGSAGYGVMGTTSNCNFLPAPINYSGVLKDKKIVDISAINSHVGGHACAVSDEGKAYCWGGGLDGALGDGRYNEEEGNYNVFEPIEVDSSGVLNGKKLIKISTGYYYTCALDDDGKAYCWGSGNSGELGNGNHKEGDIDYFSTVPVSVNMNGALNGKKLEGITTGVQHTCAYDTEGKVYCWGDGGYGKLGTGSLAEKVDVPKEIYYELP